MAITVQDFKNRAVREILIPGFYAGDEPIPVKVRALNILGMLSNKKIPNNLMPAVESLFKLGGGDKSQEEIEEIATENMVEMSEFLGFICDKTLVEPSYKEIEDYLTQDQLLAIFNSTQQTINEVKKFRNE